MTVNEAIDDVMNEDSDLSIEQRFDQIGQEIISNAYVIIKRMKKGGPSMTSEEKTLQDEMMYQLNIVEKVFSKLKKAGRIAPPANKDFDTELMGKMKDDLEKSKSSVGQIVRMIQPESGTDPENETE